MPHILIVDDEPNNLYMLRALLKSQNYDITEAVNGKEALIAALRDIPDLIIADILMPVMDGYELCRQWKANLKLQHVPFVFYSATYTEPSDIEFALKLGADKFLIKPSEPKELLSVVSQILETKSSDQRPSAEIAEIERWHKERVTAKLDKKIQDLAQETQQRRLLEHERDILISGIEHASDAIVITNTDGSINYVNPAFEKTTGYTLDEARGQNCRILQSGEHDKKFYQEMWNTLTAGRTWKGKLHNRRKDMTLYTEDSTISPVFDQSGKITNYVAVKRDVTEVLELEKKLKQAQKLESVGLLAGGIAHDFNNILFAILGNAEIALDVLPDDSPVNEMLHDVITAGRRAEDLVKQILTFSRKAAVNPIPLSIVPVIKEALKMIKANQPANIYFKFECEFTPNQGYVIADPTSIHQVILNLCTNACQAMFETGGTLSVKLARINHESERQQGSPMASNPYVEIRIKDTGSGIDPEVIEHIFEPFFTTKEVGKGTGMGLAVVHGIIQDLNGKIAVESEIGTGTEFQIHLPLAEEQCPEQLVEETATPRGFGHVLVIDDDALVTKVITSMLKDLGYTVTAHSSSVDGLAAFLSSPNAFDVVITDQNMPQMTGAELSHRIFECCPEQQIVLITGYCQTMNEEKAEHLGVSGFIRKPIAKSDLAIMLHQILH